MSFRVRDEGSAVLPGRSPATDAAAPQKLPPHGPASAEAAGPDPATTVAASPEPASTRFGALESGARKLPARLPGEPPWRSPIRGRCGRSRNRPGSPSRSTWCSARRRRPSAEVAGLSSSASSYHLRALARYDFVDKHAVARARAARLRYDRGPHSSRRTGAACTRVTAVSATVSASGAVIAGHGRNRAAAIARSPVSADHY